MQQHPIAASPHLEEPSMKRVLLIISALLTLVVGSQSQSFINYDQRFLPHGDYGYLFGTVAFPQSTYRTFLGFPSQTPTPLHQQALVTKIRPENPRFIWIKEESGGIVWPPLPKGNGYEPIGIVEPADPDNFRLLFWHDAENMLYQYGIISPLIYADNSNYINPGWPWYYEPWTQTGGMVNANLGPMIIIEIEVAPALPTGDNWDEELDAWRNWTEFGWRYTDDASWPYAKVQYMIPWNRLLWDHTDLPGGVGVFSYGVPGCPAGVQCTWPGYNATWLWQNENYSGHLSPIEEGGWGSKFTMGAPFIVNMFTTGRSYGLLSVGDEIIVQAKVHYIMPIPSSYSATGTMYQYINHYDITFYTNAKKLLVLR